MKDLTKCKEWERRRRDKLNDGFNALAQLLPFYDPAHTLTKIDILKKSTEFIKEIRLTNTRLLMEKCQPQETSKKVFQLQDEVNRLILRVKQLTELLKKANIAIPIGPSIKLLGKNKSKWSAKLIDNQDIENSIPTHQGKQQKGVKLRSCRPIQVSKKRECETPKINDCSPKTAKSIEPATTTSESPETTCTSDELNGGIGKNAVLSTTKQPNPDETLREALNGNPQKKSTPSKKQPPKAENAKVLPPKTHTAKSKWPPKSHSAISTTTRPTATVSLNGTLTPVNLTQSLNIPTLSLQPLRTTFILNTPITCSLAQPTIVQQSLGQITSNTSTNYSGAVVNTSTSILPKFTMTATGLQKIPISCIRKPIPKKKYLPRGISKQRKLKTLAATAKDLQIAEGSKAGQANQEHPENAGEATTTEGTDGKVTEDSTNVVDASSHSPPQSPTPELIDISKDIGPEGESHTSYNQGNSNEIESIKVTDVDAGHSVETDTENITETQQNVSEPKTSGPEISNTEQILADDDSKFFKCEEVVKMPSETNLENVEAEQKTSSNPVEEKEGSALELSSDARNTSTNESSDILPSSSERQNSDVDISATCTTDTATAADKQNQNMVTSTDEVDAATNANATSTSIANPDTSFLTTKDREKRILTPSPNVENITNQNESSSKNAVAKQVKDKVENIPKSDKINGQETQKPVLEAEDGSINSEDKIGECIARSIDLIDEHPACSDLIELSNADWSQSDRISPTQMFLSMFPLLPALGDVAGMCPQSHKTFLQNQNSRSSFFIDSMLPEEQSPSTANNNSTIHSTDNTVLESLAPSSSADVQPFSFTLSLQPKPTMSNSLPDIGTNLFRNKRKVSHETNVTHETVLMTPSKYPRIDTSTSSQLSTMTNLSAATLSAKHPTKPIDSFPRPDSFAGQHGAQRMVSPNAHFVFNDFQLHRSTSSTLAKGASSNVTTAKESQKKVRQQPSSKSKPKTFSQSSGRSEPANQTTSTNNNRPDILVSNSRQNYFEETAFPAQSTGKGRVNQPGNSTNSSFSVTVGSRNVTRTVHSERDCSTSSTSEGHMPRNIQLLDSRGRCPENSSTTSNFFQSHSHEAATTGLEHQPVPPFTMPLLQEKDASITSLPSKSASVINSSPSISFSSTANRNYNTGSTGQKPSQCHLQQNFATSYHHDQSRRLNAETQNVNASGEFQTGFSSNKQFTDVRFPTESSHSTRATNQFQMPASICAQPQTAVNQYNHHLPFYLQDSLNERCSDPFSCNLGPSAAVSSAHQVGSLVTSPIPRNCSKPQHSRFQNAIPKSQTQPQMNLSQAHQIGDYLTHCTTGSTNNRPSSMVQPPVSPRQPNFSDTLQTQRDDTSFYIPNLPFNHNQHTYNAQHHPSHQESGHSTVASSASVMLGIDHSTNMFGNQRQNSTVNWMTDPPAPVHHIPQVSGTERPYTRIADSTPTRQVPKGNKKSNRNSSNTNPFSVSTLVGTTSTGNSNYCAEALIRKTPMNWNLSRPNFPPQSQQANVTSSSSSVVGSSSSIPSNHQLQSSNNHFPLTHGSPQQYSSTISSQFNYFENSSTSDPQNTNNAHSQHLSMSHHTTTAQEYHQQHLLQSTNDLLGHCHHGPTSSVSNFNLSTIFPEINDNRIINSSKNHITYGPNKNSTQSLNHISNIGHNHNGSHQQQQLQGSNPSYYK